MRHPYKNLENFTLSSLLNRSVDLYRDRPSFGMVSQKAMSYGEFMQKVHKTVEMLQKNGISKGDKVVLLSENMPNWGVAYFAVTYFGAVIVPILTDFHPSDIHHIIKHSEAKAMFVSDKCLESIEEDEIADIKFVIGLNRLEIVEDLTDTSYMTQIKKRLSVLSNEKSAPSEDDLAAIIYTSGTTGHSKGVMLSHKNLVTNALSSHSKINMLPSDVFLSILPLAHTFECTVGLIIPILHGSSVYYIDKMPTPTVLLKSFSIVKPTMIVSVPLIIEKIYKNKILAKFNSSFILRNLYKIPFIRKKLNELAGKKLIETFGGKLRFFAIGGASLPFYVEEFLIEAKFPYLVGYGLTETAPMLAGSVLGRETKIRSTGTAFDGVEIRIDKKDPKTGEGEIVVKSPSLMMGYYKDKEKTDEVFENGWFLTGDLGYIDKDGFLFIRGRSKNVIIGSGGKNIYPEQIESIINKSVGVLDSLVMEQDSKLMARVLLDYEFIDEKFESHINSNTKLQKDISDLLEEMRADVNSQLASFSKIVKFIEQREPFIKTPTKKIKRYLYAN